MKVRWMIANCVWDETTELGQYRKCLYTQVAVKGVDIASIVQVHKLRYVYISGHTNVLFQLRSADSLVYIITSMIVDIDSTGVTWLMQCERWLHELLPGRLTSLQNKFIGGYRR